MFSSSLACFPDWWIIVARLLQVIVPKMKGEPLGVVIVESGWGSMVPTVVLANMLPNGPAARCGQLNIGDQIISINGVSLVGLPLSACQTYIKVSGRGRGRSPPPPWKLVPAGTFSTIQSLLAPF